MKLNIIVFDFVVSIYKVEIFKRILIIHLIMAMDFVAFRISTNLQKIEHLLVNQRIILYLINNAIIY